VLAALAACDYPTSLPILETQWVIPTEETQLGVAELLPGTVTLQSDLSAFIVDFTPISFSQTLGQICVACAAADGLTVPKPAFIGNVLSTIDFPAKVSGVTILDGTVDLQITNGLNFDPIRPSPSARGSITIRITDSADGDLVGSLIIDGTTTAFPQGQTLSRSVVLNAATVDGGLTTTVTVDSPLGSSVTIDAGRTVSATATANNVRVASVDIDVASESVTLDPVALDLQDVDSEVADRVISAAFILDVTNPFGVGAQFQLSVAGPTITTINKSVTISGNADETLRVDFSVAEIRSMLGEANLTMTGGGTLDSGAGVITVYPGDELVLSASLDLALRIGG
jgi:hypothetical protein